MKEKKIYALGFFDGVHLGHQALLTACCHMAEQSDCRPGAVTFDIHPETLVTGNAPKLISTPRDRSAWLQNYGIRDILELPFDEKLRSLHWRDFLEMLLKKGAAGFVCGDDFRFGFHGEGNAEKLAEFCKAHNLPFAVVPAQSLDGTRISSTHIRTLLETGALEEANRFLGHDYGLTGRVVPGRQLGRTIGIPTANLELPNYLVQPKFGVYACAVTVDGKRYAAVTNVGTRPTVEGHHVTVEPWILDFDGDLYGRYITLSFYRFLRPEQKFGSLEELKQQIQKDAERTRQTVKIP